MKERKREKGKKGTGYFYFRLLLFKLDVSSLVKGALTAGVLSGIGGALDSTLGIDKIDNKYIKTATSKVANTTLRSGINSAVYGTDFEDSLKYGLATQATNLGFEFVGDTSMLKELYEKNEYFTEGALGKVALHGLAGGIGAELAGGDFKVGAASAGIRELISPLTSMPTDKELTKEEIAQYKTIQLAISQLSGTLVGAALNGDEGATTGYHITTSAELYNRQLHEKEIQLLKSKAKEYAIKHNIDESEARKLFYVVGRSMVDEIDNKTLTKELSKIVYIDKYLGVNTDSNSLKQHISQIRNIIIDKSKGMYFKSVSSPDLDNNRVQEYFTTTDKQYKNHTLYPYTVIGGMKDDSEILMPVVPLLGNSVRIGNTLGKEVYYNVSNKFLSNPAKYTQSGVNFSESLFLPGIPSMNWWGLGGYGVGKIYEHKNDIKELSDKLLHRDKK